MRKAPGDALPALARAQLVGPAALRPSRVAGGFTGVAPGALARRLGQSRGEERTRQRVGVDDHQHPQQQVAHGKAPAQQHPQQEAELEHEIGRGDQERERVHRVRALGQHRARRRQCGERAGRRDQAEKARQRRRAHSALAEHPGHLLARDQHLNRGRDHVAESERPEGLPEHSRRGLQRLENRVHHVGNEMQGAYPFRQAPAALQPRPELDFARPVEPARRAPAPVNGSFHQPQRRPV